MQVRQDGFTILEMSIVLIIISLITALGVTSGISALEGAKRSQTESKLRIIEEALMTFRISNNRLPCPTSLTLTKGDANYGQEALTPGVCAGTNFGAPGEVVEGGVPTKPLNLPSDFMYDGWGRKIEYAVDSNATEINAFSAIGIPESCGITVNDGSGNARSTGAIYALVSYGSDGHGGYLQTGNRMSTGSTNADALTNCHCNSDGNTTLYEPTFVQRERFDDSFDARQSFTNIVRFKERWQMITEEDQFSFALGKSYRGPNVAVGYVLPAAGNDSTYVYKMQCGKMLKGDTLDPVGTEATTGTVFTPNNRYLVAFSATGCVVYPISNNKVNTGNALAVPGCPAYDTSVQVDMSQSGFLAMTSPIAPYIYLWQRSGSSFVALPTPAPPPANPVSLMSITASYLMVYDGTTLTVYGRSSSSFSALASQPGGVPAGIFSATLSQNEHYLAATVNGNVSGTPAPMIYIWRFDTGPVFTALPTISMENHDTPYSITFSADGKFFSVGGTNGDNVVIYKIDSGDTFTRLDPPEGWSNSSSTPGITFSFSKDSNYLAMGTPSSSRPVVLFRRISAKQFKFLTEPDQVQPYPALSVRFNH